MKVIIRFNVAGRKEGLSREQGDAHSPDVLFRSTNVIGFLVPLDSKPCVVMFLLLSSEIVNQVLWIDFWAFLCHLHNQKTSLLPLNVAGNTSRESSVNLRMAIPFICNTLINQIHIRFEWMQPPFNRCVCGLNSSLGLLVLIARCRWDSACCQYDHWPARKSYINKAWQLKASRNFSLFVTSSSAICHGAPSS